MLRRRAYENRAILSAHTRCASARRVGPHGGSIPPASTLLARQDGCCKPRTGEAGHDTCAAHRRRRRARSRGRAGRRAHHDGERRPTGKEVQGHREETANVRVRAFRDPGAKGR